MLGSANEHDGQCDLFCSSIFFTINRLVSRNLSTQFTRQLSSLREKRPETVPVMHLPKKTNASLFSVSNITGEKGSLIPAHFSEVVDLAVQTRLRLLLLEKLLELFL